VIVSAVADTPLLNLGDITKPLALEGSVGKQYPVQIGLNDLDGSESYSGQKIVMQVSFPSDISNGAPPLVEFTKLKNVDVAVTGSNPFNYTLTGSMANVEAALDSLRITPGKHNGEDITVMVTVVAEETNPSEIGPGEISVLSVTVIDSFIIPVDPQIIGEPTITLSSAVNCTEDTTCNLGSIKVSLNGTADSDGSEVYYLEIQAEPGNPEFDNTRWWIDGVEVVSLMNYAFDGWIRLPNSTNVAVSILPPKDFSG
jgi:hypothetical protein